MKSVKFTLGPQEIAALRDIGHAAATDETRQVLTCVQVRLASGGLYVIATDSYMLAVRKLSSDHIDKGPLSVLVGAKALRAAAKEALKPKFKKEVPVRELTVSVDGVELATASGSVTVSAYKEGTFPTIETILAPKDAVPVVAKGVCLNPHFVERLGRALSVPGDSERAQQGLRMEFVKANGREVELSPVYVQSVTGNPEEVALLMPVRV